jgi:hypothetical protein
MGFGRTGTQNGLIAGRGRTGFDADAARRCGWNATPIGMLENQILLIYKDLTSNHQRAELARHLPKSRSVGSNWRVAMNQKHVVQSASKAVLRARNALDDLHAYLLQLKGQVIPQDLLATSGKVSHARELVREIDAALTHRSLILSTRQAVHASAQPSFGSDIPTAGSELAAEQPFG